MKEAIKTNPEIPEKEILEYLEKFMKEDTLPSSQKTDLYYWIDILDKVDEIFEKVVKEYISSPINSQQRACLKYKLEVLLSFTEKLLHHAASKSIYNSVEVYIYIYIYIYST